MKHHKYHILSNNTPHINADNGPNTQRARAVSGGGREEAAEPNYPPRLWRNEKPSYPDESNKNRNRKSPRFSVANVPVASQTAVGTLFSPKNCKNNRNRLRFFVAGKHRKSLWGGGGLFWGPRNRCEFFTYVRKSQSLSQKNRDTWCTQLFSATLSCNFG